MKIARDSWILICVALADLITTMMWVDGEHNLEANPLFAWLLELGPAYFVGAKLLLIAVPIGVLEWARRKRPRFTSVATRAAIFAYLGLYAVGVYKHNRETLPVAAAIARSDGTRLVYNGVEIYQGVYSPPASPEQIRETRQRLNLPPRPDPTWRRK
jgi:hypothetical protein